VVTTDYEAWAKLDEELRKFVGAGPIVFAVRNVVEWLRERQKRGDVGPEVCPKCETPAPLEKAHECATASEEALREALKDAHERIAELGRQREEAAAANVQLFQERDEHRARAEAAGRRAGSYFEAAAVSNQRYDRAVRAESLLKEALGQLRSLGAPRQFPDPCWCDTAAGTHCVGQTRCLGIWSLLSKAKAQGFLPDGEVTT
jgi:hypothetical protein